MCADGRLPLKSLLQLLLLQLIQINNSAAPVSCGGVCHNDQVQVPVSHGVGAIVADVCFMQGSHVRQAQLKLISRASSKPLSVGDCQLLLSTAGQFSYIQRQAVRSKQRSSYDSNGVLNGSDS